MEEQSFIQDINSIQDLVLLMRFNSLIPNKNSFTYLSFKKISDLLQIRLQEIIQICKRQQSSHLKYKFSNQKRKDQFSEEQILFLTSQVNLQKQAGYSLQERCIQFHRKFPETFIKPYMLRQIYLRQGIKRKVVRIKKYTSTKQDQRKQHLYQIMIDLIQQALKENRKLIFVDEVIFTYQTNLKQEYSNINENIDIKDKLFSHKCLAVVAAISIEQGLEEYYTFEKSINIDKFEDFLLGLKDKNNTKKLTLILDNLRVHHSKNVKQLCQQLDIQLIFTPPYSPEINPIENYFSLVKNIYKRQKLISLGKDQKINPKLLIKRSFETIQTETIKSLCLKKIVKLGLKFQ